MDRWITDREPSARHPLSTRANAGEVLPEPVSPLGWTLVCEPCIVMGWAGAQVAVGTLDPGDLDPRRPEAVVDLGAQVSHAVIVSRELGTPCVVSVHDATHTIPDGVVVTADGISGTVTVTVIELPEG